MKKYYTDNRFIYYAFASYIIVKINNRKTKK